ncbi:MAG: hypothetical protein MUC88_26455 [Planctomycetes bacterium]|jgi:hypothetical protein|nr:hypothetical protein [Planctomycetota bacterium]
MGTLRAFSVGLVFLVVSCGLAGCGGSQRQAAEPEGIGIHTYEIDGLTLQTGDLICTNTTRGRSVFAGFFYRLFGMAIPGPIDHVIVYVGPGGRCVEAGAKLRVLTFEIPGHTWDPAQMKKVRGPIFDNLYGVAYPLAGRSLSAEREAEIRECVARYCLRQAQAGKPYNVIFANSATDEAFYCSQLAYKAYLEQGIDLNTNLSVPEIPGTDSIVFPQEVWAGCQHVRAPSAPAGQAQPIP